MLGRAAATGVLSGLLGTAVMTASEKIEQRLTHRPNSQVPGRAMARMLGHDVAPDTPRLRRINLATHFAMGAGVGAIRGVMAYAGLRGPLASAMFTVVRLNCDQIMENWTGVGAPPWTWPRLELTVDVFQKTVYAFTTGAVADILAGRAGPPPGEAHAGLRSGRRADVGPPPWI